MYTIYIQNEQHFSEVYGLVNVGPPDICCSLCSQTVHQCIVFTSSVCSIDVGGQDLSMAAHLFLVIDCYYMCPASVM